MSFNAQSNTHTTTSPATHCSEVVQVHNCTDITGEREVESCNLQCKKKICGHLHAITHSPCPRICHGPLPTLLAGLHAQLLPSAAVPFEQPHVVTRRAIIAVPLLAAAATPALSRSLHLQVSTAVVSGSGRQVLGVLYCCCWLGVEWGGNAVCMQVGNREEKRTSRYCSRSKEAGEPITADSS